MKKYKIYMHKNKINGKIYIGQTYQSVNQRWRSNGSGHKGQPFYNAIQKYGWNNFEHKILIENITTQEEAYILEKYYINKYDTYNSRFGYNATKGGDMNILTNCKSVLCNGIKYDSITECARELNINSYILSSYLSKKRLPPDLYSQKIHFCNEDFSIYECYTDEIKFKNRSDAFKDENNPRSLSVTCDNIRYNTIKDFSQKYDLNPSIVGRWLSKEVNMPLKFINLNLRYSDDISTKYNAGKNCKKKVICENITFDSITQCADYYKIDRRMLSRYLNGETKMKAIWTERNLKYA